MSEIFYLKSDNEILYWKNLCILSLFYYKIRGSDIGFPVHRTEIYLVLSATSVLSWLKQIICLGATHAMMFFWFKSGLRHRSNQCSTVNLNLCISIVN
jgi:hypothetical protein